MSDIDYTSIYDRKFFTKSDGIKSLDNSCLKFGDAFSAICYAHDISYQQICEQFPYVASNNRYEGSAYTLQQQLDFVTENKKRTPKKILEIGAGRLEVTMFLSSLGYDVTAIEPTLDIKEVAKYTKHKLFDDVDLQYTLINKPFDQVQLDYSEFDTILMVESLEHILAEHFDPQWEKISQTFKGYFVVTNWLQYHPIAVGQYAGPSIHCRLVDDELYDRFCEGNQTLHRDRSHLSIKL